MKCSLFFSSSNSRTVCCYASSSVCNKQIFPTTRRECSGISSKLYFTIVVFHIYLQRKGYRYLDVLQMSRSTQTRSSVKYLCKVVTPISRQIFSTPSRPVLDRKTKIARRCSFCGELGHNSRTCHNVSDRKRIEKTLCPRCRGSGVIPCPLCSCYDAKSIGTCENHTATSAFELTNFSKLKFIYKGRNMRQVCTKCGGSALMVCPDCFGFI